MIRKKCTATSVGFDLIKTVFNSIKTHTQTRRQFPAVQMFLASESKWVRFFIQRFQEQSNPTVLFSDPTNCLAVRIFQRSRWQPDPIACIENPPTIQAVASSNHDFVILTKDGEDYGAPKLLENLDAVFVRTQLYPIHLLQGVSRLNPGLLFTNHEKQTVGIQ